MTEEGTWIWQEGAMDVQGVVRVTGVKKPEVGGGRARERVPHARRQHPGWRSTNPAYSTITLLAGPVTP